MKIFKRILLGFLILIALAAITGFFVIRSIGHRALPDYNSNIHLKGLHAAVEVFRDKYAIPHVYAKNEEDLYMATGYLVAQDRLWQMDLLRRVTEGRLSEIFGKEFVETDLLLRSLRFNKKSEQILAHTDSLSRLALEAFAAGVNQYIEDNRRKLPPEFAILQYKPEKWEAVHSLNMIGYMAWDLKAGWSEILLIHMRKALDSVRYNQIIPDAGSVQPTVYPYGKSKDFSSLLPLQLLNTALLQNLGTDVFDGSNNWAVSGSRTNTGKPFLANDMHLGLNIPGIWYQIHQVVPGKINVTGLLLPGAPVVVCGHNDSIAWGMTNTYVDNLDFYEEKITADSSYYEYQGEKRKIEVVKTQIRIGKKDHVERTLRFTHRGPVVSSFKNMNDHVVTMHWVGDEPSDEFRSIMQLNRANNWYEFKNALKAFTSISQNIAYADVKGNIGLFCAAGIPIRDRSIPFGILPGNTNKFDWKGYVPFEELPYQYNPAIGHVASANNRTVPSDYPYHIGTWYSLPSRYERITEMLSAKSILTSEDMISIQLDQKSKMAEKYLPLFLNALSDYKIANNSEMKALEILRGWNYEMRSSSEAATIFESLYLKLSQCIYADELGNELYLGFSGIPSISRVATDQLIDRGISIWFDNVNTEAKEDYNQLVACAFSGAVADLTLKLGAEPEKWKWGHIHTFELEHPLAKVNALKQIFGLNRGPFEVGGSFHTVSPYSYSNNKPFSVNHGSSHRHIFDLSDWNKSLTVIPTGISGIPASKHYCDQTGLYISGRYHVDYFTRDKVEEYAVYRMQFNRK